MHLVHRTRREPRHRFYYGWVLITALGITTMISYGTTQYLFGLLVIPLTSTFQWSRASISLVYALSLIFAGLFGVPIGFLVDRWGARWLMTAGSALACPVFLALGHVQTLWQFGVCWSGGVGLVMALTLYPVSFTVATNWFHQRRGTALAVLTLLGGLASPLFLPLSGVLITRLGWQMTLTVLGFVHLAIAMPLHGFLVRCCPEDLGLFPDGTPVSPALSSALLSGMTPGQAFRSLSFWKLTASLALITASGDLLVVHQVAALISRGYDAEWAATLVGGLGLASLPGRYLFNRLSERIAPQTLLEVGVGLQAIGVIVLLSASNLGWVVAYLVLYGVVYGAISPLGASIMAEHLGRRAYGMITAVQGIAITLCSAFAILGAGWLYDRFGNYTLTFWLCALAFILAAFGLLLTPLPEK